LELENEMLPFESELRPLYSRIRGLVGD